eukprot:3383386-Prymnesium_polylepis.1
MCFVPRVLNDGASWEVGTPKALVLRKFHTGRSPYAPTTHPLYSVPAGGRSRRVLCDLGTRRRGSFARDPARGVSDTALSRSLGPELPGLDCWPLRGPAFSRVVARRGDAVVGSLLVDSHASANALSVDGFRLIGSRSLISVPALLLIIPIGVMTQ